MNKQVYFDYDELETGKYFNLSEEIRSEEGHLFEIEDWIDRGGNASVFSGYDKITGNECAIKFLMYSNSTIEKRFTREIYLLKKIKGDHTIGYLGSGKVSARHNKTNRNSNIRFIIMERAEFNLLDATRKNSKIGYEIYSGQFRGLAEALATLHSIGAVHRDIKPENILVSGDRWLLSDYGLCSMVIPNRVDPIRDSLNIGPKYWLSPEAHNLRLGNTDKISSASDVFQLASIFWYVVTGRHPCGVVTKADWSGPSKLFDVLYMSLHHNAKKRPQDGNAFLTDLESALSS